ncbi:MAG: endo-1,4-beta-xylanase [Terracidiphilus sp.]
MTELDPQASPQMNEEEKPQVTRRQFGRTAAAAGAAALVGAAGLAEWRLMEHNLRLRAATQPAVTGENSLVAHAVKKGILCGAAVVPHWLDVHGTARGRSRDPYTQLVSAQTGVLVDEYTTYWKWLRPSPDRFDFSRVDRMMRFAKLTGKRVRGHVLVWYYAMPRWFARVATKDNAPQLLVDHIRTVAGHMRGQIDTWDVVNEAIEPDDGRPDGLRKSQWLDLIGPDYIELAFRAAAEADPQAKLAYNEFGIETDRPRDARKRDKMLELLQRLKTGGVPIQVVGVQSHLLAMLPEPGVGIIEFIREVGKMGLEVHISELDVNCMHVKGGAAERDAVVARMYKNYLDLVVPEPNVKQVITWGISDAHTWLKSAWLFNGVGLRHPWAGLVDALRQRPLPFDENYQPTQAFWALRGALDAAPVKA